MPNLNDFFAVDGLTDVTAAIYNNLLASSLRAEYRNVETISVTTRALTDADTPIQRLTPSGSNRSVTLPAPGINNHPFLIINAATSLTLQVGGLVVLLPGESALFVSDGTGWRIEADRMPRDARSGLQLQWVSGTALTVSSGFAVLPNGTRVNVRTPIAKTGLSLPGSMFYHVYLLYTSGASPDIEIVTTAPDAPYFGLARAKTGDTTRRYLGSVLVVSGSIQEFTHLVDSGYISYTNVNAPKRVLAAGTATVKTAVSVAGAVPATATAITLLAINTGTPNLIIVDNSDLAYLTVPTGRAASITPLHLGNIYYKIASSGGSAFLDVLGYFFDR